MIAIRIHTALAVAAAAVVLAGCGGSDSPQTPPAAPSGAEQSGSAAPAGQQSDQVVLDVAIQGGTVTPTNEQMQAEVGQPIVLRVDSDAADELHVHSTPERTFPVAGEVGQTFEFTVDMPGRVDVELHNTRATIATILVR